MDKVLVSIYVPSIEKEFNVYLPINIKLLDVINSFQKDLVDMSDNNFEIIEKPVVYNDYDGKILNLNNIVKDCGLKKGCRLLLR
jgi:hypothetical protein